MRVIGVDDKGNVIVEKTSAIEEFGAAASKVFREIMQALTPVFQQLADIVEAMEREAEIWEENRIRREIRAVQRKQCSRIRSQTWQQAKSTLKYKRYELRIYGRKERRGFHE